MPVPIISTAPSVGAVLISTVPVWSPSSFHILRWVLVGPGLEFPNIEKTGRGTLSTRLVFLDQKKLIGALSGSSEEFLVSLKYGKSICICRGPD